MRSSARLPFGMAFAVAACGAASAPLPPDAVILPESTVAEMLHQCSRQAPASGEAAWTPASEDIARLEGALAGAIRARPEIRRSHFPGDPDWTRVPRGWRRQYIGIVRGGRRFIYGNFYPRRDDETAIGEALDWRRRPMGVCDGGAPFFGAEYDVDAGRFTQLAFNGEL